MQEVQSKIDTKEGRVWLLDILRQQEVEITFTKKNGEKRVMSSTLNFDLIPKEFHPKTQVTEDKKEEESVPTTLAVYDTNAKGWRSFLWANVNEVKFDQGVMND